MNILILKTDISSENALINLQKLFETYSPIKNWSVDTEDVDKVLRVEAPNHILERDLMLLLKIGGFNCDVLE